MKRALPYLVLLATFSFTNIAYAAASATSSAIIGPNGIEVKASAQAGNAQSYSESTVSNQSVTTTTKSSNSITTAEVESVAKTNTSKKDYSHQAKESKTVKASKDSNPETPEIIKISQTIPPAITQAMDDKKDSVITEKTVKRFSGFMVSILIFQVINTILLFSLLFKLYKPAQQRF
ncbi:hypothetical protein KC644_00595 [Candidatus Berkelbacteria bacterium]|nr:hypothetical protein [Candidatus Berkelbacteria bacterium]